MGDVADQPALRGNQRFDLFRHVVEVAAEVREFVLALGRGAVDAGAQIAGCEAMRGCAELADGRGDVAGEPEADQTGHEGDD